MTAELVPRPSIALASVAVLLGPTCIIASLATVFVGRLSVVAWTTAECPRIVISIARSDLGLAPVVIVLAVVGAAAASATRGAGVPLIVTRVAIARVKIEHAPLR